MGVETFVEGKLSGQIDFGSWRSPDKEAPLQAPQTAIEERLRERLRNSALRSAGAAQFPISFSRRARP